MTQLRQGPAGHRCRVDLEGATERGAGRDHFQLGREKQQRLVGRDDDSQSTRGLDERMEFVWHAWPSGPEARGARHETASWSGKSAGQVAIKKP
jgi:hypothetical protein